MKTKKHIIWSSDIKLDDWEDYCVELLTEHPDLSDDDLYRRCVELNDLYLDDERDNLNVELGSTILLVADLGLWDGRRHGYKMIRNTNLRACLWSPLRDCGDSIEWYVDELNDLRCREAHHDGVNYYTYRVWKPDATDQQKLHLLQKIIAGTITRRDLTRCTRRLGDYVNAVYGW